MSTPAGDSPVLNDRGPNLAVPEPGFWAVFFALVGALPLLSGWFGYHVTMVILGQVGPLRILGVLQVLALGLVLVALPLAMVAKICGLTDAHFVGPWRWLFFLAVIGDLAFTGLCLFYLTPRAAPVAVLGLTAAMLALTIWRFWTFSLEEQARVTHWLVRFGQGMLAVLFVPAPVVVYAAANDHPHFALSPLPPVAPSLVAHPPRRIVLITFDALRARSTNMHSPALDTTPALAALSKQSTWFDNCRAAADMTILSVPTILTGMRPEVYFPAVGTANMYPRHGFLTGVAGFLDAAGYRSYYATMLLRPRLLGIQQEFVTGTMLAGMFQRNLFNTHEFLPVVPAVSWLATRLTTGARAEEILPASSNEIDAVRGTFDHGLRYLKSESGPTFVWLHIGAPHTPYFDVPRADLGGPYHPERYKKMTEGQVSIADPTARRECERIYENYVRFADAELGRFITALRSDRAWPETMLVVTADHGEDFTPPPGVIPHGNGGATEDVAHVPLVIHAPGQQVGKMVKGTVGHIDVLPTILGRVYREVPPGLPGIPLLAVSPPPDRMVYTWAMASRYIAGLPRARSVSACQGNEVYFWSWPGPHEKLYDRTRDPRGSQDLSVLRPERLIAMRQRVRQEIAPD